MNAEQIVASVFPFLAEELKEDREKDRIETKKLSWVDNMKSIMNSTSFSAKDLVAMCPPPEPLTPDDGVALLTA